jgi:von Willebrand factor type A domain
MIAGHTPLILASLLTLLLPATLPPAAERLVDRKADELSKVFKAWYKDYKAGKLEPGDEQGTLRKSYITEELRTEKALPKWFGRPTRINEARQIFKMLRKRGSLKDGERLVAVVLVGAKKKSGLLVGGNFWTFRQAVLPYLTGPETPRDIKKAVAKRLEKGLVIPKPDAKSPVWKHKDPITARLLAPLVGSYENQLFRGVLESLLKVESPDLQIAAAKGLGKMKSGNSMEKVSEILANLEYHDQIVEFADALILLAKADKPKANEEQLVHTLRAVLDVMVAQKNWRTRSALIPVLRTLRGKASIPVLIGLLEEAKADPGQKGKGTAFAFSGTLLRDIAEALKDLTGYFAPANQSERWRSWWDGQGDDFKVKPPSGKRPDRSSEDSDKPRIETSASSFFGIPVTGSRVVFILDVSGSMLWYMGRRFPRRFVPPKGDNIDSRIKRAKKELLGAINGMTSDDKFNVVFFSSKARVWRKKLVVANKGNKKAIATAVERIEAKGSTALYDAVRDGLEIKAKRKPGARYSTDVDEVFLLSDGAPTAGEILDLQQILDRVKGFNRGARIRINAIYLGTKEPAPHTAQGIPLQSLSTDEFMKLLAEQNRGKFRMVK